MSNPIEATRDFLLSVGVTGGWMSTKAPTGDIPEGFGVVQYGWDGTPSDAPNREDCAIRITAWAPKGQVSNAALLAGALRRSFLDYSSESVWRVGRGAGRLPGVDPDTGLPFCTFTVYVVMRDVAS